MTKKCNSCGSVCELTEHHYPMRDIDSLPCEVCGTTLHYWNGGHYFSALLLEKNEDFDVSLGGVFLDLK